jgi:hypothetical protein
MGMQERVASRARVLTAPMRSNGDNTRRHERGALGTQQRTVNGVRWRDYPTHDGAKHASREGK